MRKLGTKYILLITTGLYILYICILIHPPRKGWDLILVKATLALITTLLYISLMIAYAALKDLI